MTKDTTIAVPMNVAVAAKLALDPAAQPPSPLPDVQPPAVLAPKPIRPPATTSSAPARICQSPVNVRVSQPPPLASSWAEIRPGSGCESQRVAALG
jgi:hypothetical protein